MSANRRIPRFCESQVWCARWGILLALIFSCQQAWAQTPQAYPPSETPQSSPAPSTKQAPQGGTPAQGDLTQLSIENLMNVDVTSVSKKEQKLARTAAAVFVITQEDIRRSGATNIPDVLRIVPGLDVAQINANTWAISARGLNGQFSNELLVLLDGRNVYTPTFGGVFWDVLDVPLEDIGRIEVIRGPGGSIWGANAVNGVINIITKKASETRGGILVAGGGNTDHGFGTAQYGGSAGKKFDYRIFTKYEDQDHMPNLIGQNGADNWHMLRGGFRIDGTLSTKDSLIAEGDIYTGEEDSPMLTLPSLTSTSLINVVFPVPVSGGFLQTVWNHTFSAHSDTTLMLSYDTYDRDAQLQEARKTFGIDFQHHLAWGERQDFVWGLSNSYSLFNSIGDLFLSLHPNDINTNAFSAFVQDEIALRPGRFFLVTGTKLERSPYSGWVLMPSVRTTYAVSERQMLWAAVSRALRTPAATDTSIRINLPGAPGAGGVPTVVSLLGNPKFQNEGLVAYEFGYRTTFKSRLTVDFAAFYNDYDKQQTEEPSPPFFESTPAPPHLVVPSTYENLEYGETHGLEVAANWKVTNRWTLSSGYAFERVHMRVSPTSVDAQSAEDDGGETPDVQAQLRSHFEMGKRLTWDTSAYFVDRLASSGVPSYTRLDSGLTWKWTENASISVVGQNLLRDHHLEFVESVGASSANQIKRSAYAKLTWRF